MKIETYRPGVPYWAQLTTDDPAAARAFYRALFGWRFTKRRGGERRRRRDLRARRHAGRVDRASRRWAALEMDELPLRG